MGNHVAGRADEETTGWIVSSLVNAYEQLLSFRASAGKDVEYLDGLMGCLNFFRAVVLDLEHRLVQRDVRSRETLRVGSVVTLAKVLGVGVQVTSRDFGALGEPGEIEAGLYSDHAAIVEERRREDLELLRAFAQRLEESPVLRTAVPHQLMGDESTAGIILDNVLARVRSERENRGTSEKE